MEHILDPLESQRFLMELGVIISTYCLFVVPYNIISLSIKSYSIELLKMLRGF